MDNEPEQQSACQEDGHENTVNYKRPAVKVHSDNKKIKRRSRRSGDNQVAIKREEPVDDEMGR